MDINIDMKVWVCHECGLLFAVPSALEKVPGCPPCLSRQLATANKDKWDAIVERDEVFMKNERLHKRIAKLLKRGKK